MIMKKINTVIAQHLSVHTHNKNSTKIYIIDDVCMFNY